MTHPLTTNLSEQILSLIRLETFSLLGAVQDNKVVLGGSAGSAGGVGDPPAGFVGQLAQSNVTFDTAGSSRPCIAGSAGSESLVDNLDAIRLGHEICNDAIKDRHIDWGLGTGQVSAADVPMEFVTGATYDNVQDWSNTTQSAGLISGGTITDAGGGTIDVAAGTGLIRQTDDDRDGVETFFDWSSSAGLAPTNDETNYIYARYNGGSPDVQITNDHSSISFTDEFTIGRVFWDGAIMHILNSGTHIYDGFRRMHRRVRELRPVERASGAILSEVSEPNRNIAVTAGILYSGIDRLTTPAFSSGSSVGDTFTYWYYDGDLPGGADWVAVAAQTQISKTQYNDVATGLANLSANRYGVHWVYLHHEGHVDVVYGQGDYKLGEAEESTVPSTLPPILVEFAVLVGRIIIKINIDSFTEVVTAFEQFFPTSVPASHGDLADLGADDHTQYLLADGSRNLTGTIHSEGSTFPDLGSTTLAEALGDVYLGTAKDVYPNVDEAGVGQRLVYGGYMSPGGATDDFDGAAAAAGWNWAGAPFVTPNALFTTDSVMRIQFAAANNRAFYWRNDALTGPYSVARVILHCLTVGNYVGLRLDDGTDDNYYEVVLYYTAANQFDARTRTRLGAGAITTTIEKVLNYPMWYTLDLRTYGTPWTDWNCISDLLVNAPVGFTFVAGGLFTQAWTPTRRGLVFGNPAGGGAWEGGLVDWYGTV